MLECLTPWYLIWNLFNVHTCSDIYSGLPPSDLVTLTDYLPYLLKTLVLELPFFYLFLKTIKSVKEIFLINLVLNLATHPFIFIALPLILNHFEFNYLQYLISAEIFAPTIEALILYSVYKLSARRSIAAAVFANLFSWSIGVFWL